MRRSTLQDQGTSDCVASRRLYRCSDIRNSQRVFGCVCNSLFVRDSGGTQHAADIARTHVADIYRIDFRSRVLACVRLVVGRRRLARADAARFLRMLRVHELTRMGMFVVWSV